MSDLLFGTEFHRLETALSAREQLQSIRAANIANADTPNYHADTRTFDDVFHHMIESDKGTMDKTNSRHMDISGNEKDMVVFSTAPISERMDGNTVNIQSEMEKLAENQLMHEYTLRIIEDRLQGLKTAIKKGGQY